MTVYINPSKAKGTVVAPPSKSVSHRALICAALSGGSTIGNIEYCDDIRATLGALKAMGAQIEKHKNTVRLGLLKPESIPSVNICCGESGSTLRFLIPLCMLSGSKVTFTGAARLFERDLSVYEEIAGKQDIFFELKDASLTVGGKLKAGTFCVNGDVSSQFISGLMFALPLLDGDSKIKLRTPLESKPYVDITIDVLSRFGIEIDSTEHGYFIKGNQFYKSVDYTVEGDYSNAAALEILNLYGGEVSVTGLNPDTVQGDRVYKEIFKTIGSGGSYDLSDCPDLAPLLFGVSAYLSGARFTGTSRLKIKESDRAECMKQELSKFGADVTVLENEVIIDNKELSAPREPLYSHNDHRIVMALCGLLSVYGGEIMGAEAVNKSYPSFFEDIKKLGIEVKMYD